VRSRKFLAAALAAALTAGAAGAMGPSLASATPATPTAATPKDPIIIVSGLTSPAIAHALLKARFEADGYKVTIFELPGGGLGDIRDTAAAFAPVVDQVLASTGASKVDLIGHSEGTLVARYYINKLGGAPKVDSYISLAGPHYGTYAGNIADFFGIDIFCEACEQMAIGSDFLNDLNAGPDVAAGVAVTTFRTNWDLAVRPVDNAKLKDGANNILVQDQCWWKTTGHSDFAFDGAAYDGMRDAIRKEAVHMNCWAL
jgi:pimeloyl-ACP methyl ester carboxylesterase